jgi:hypothetical protein
MKPTAANLIWLAAYVATMLALVWAMYGARNWAIESFGTPDARAEWEAWRVEAKKQASGGGPVLRRAPKSDEPPALVLMREHFVTTLATSLLLGTVLFGTMALMLRGVFSPNPALPRADRESVGG